MPPIGGWKSGVYLIRNLQNGKVYVGSATSFKIRWGNHRSDLKHGRHDNQHLQRAWVKYGEASFVFEILEGCFTSRLIEREQHWIDHYRSFDRSMGYNISPTAGSTLGTTRTEEVKKKIGENIRKAFQANPEIVAKIRATLKKNHDDPLIRKAQREGIRAVSKTKEWRDKQAAGSAKIRATPEYKQSLVAGIAKRNLDPTYQTKLRKAIKLMNMTGGVKTSRRLQAIKQHQQGRFGHATRKNNKGRGSKSSQDSSSVDG